MSEIRPYGVYASCFAPWGLRFDERTYECVGVGAKRPKRKKGILGFVVDGFGLALGCFGLKDSKKAEPHLVSRHWDIKLQSGSLLCCVMNYNIHPLGQGSPS
jgi:hypothetical protein